MQPPMGGAPEYQPDTIIIGQSASQVVVPASIGGGMTVVQAGIGRPMQMMSIIDAVKNVLVNNYAGFEGRASRSEYWWFFLTIQFLFFIPLGMIDGILFGWGSDDPMWISWLFNLALFLPSLAVGVRRIHDHGKSGWWILMPFYNLYLFIAEGEAMPNAHGPVPTNLREGNSGTPNVFVQQPMQQQYQQPIQQEYQKPPPGP